MSTKRSPRFLLVPCLAGILCASCNKDGDFGSASAEGFSVGFLGSTALIAEGGSASAVGVMLFHADPTIEAGVPITAKVRATGNGTATEVDDYDSFQDVVVDFPIGSRSGDTVAIDVAGIADTLVEGLETFELVLEDPGQGASIAATNLLLVGIDDANLATLSFTTAASTTADEGSTFVDVTVELDFEAGDTLLYDATVLIADTGTGSASSGSDYAPFGSQTVTFTKDSTPGTTVMVSVQVQDDALAEGDETVVLELFNPSAGYGLATRRHVLTITEDEVVPPGSLEATLDPDGAATPFANGDTVDLGSRTVGTGEGPPQIVRLENTGVETIGLSPPTLAGANPEDFSIEIDVGSALTAAWDGPAAIAPSPFTRRSDSAAKGLELGVDAGALRQLAALPRARIVGFPLPGGGAVTLELARVSSPWSPNAILAVDGEPVPGGASALLEDLSFWRGRVADIDGSSVFLALSPHGSRGWVRLTDDPDDTLQLEVERTPAGAVQRIVWQAQLPGPAHVSPEEFCSGALEHAGTDLAALRTGRAGPPVEEALDPTRCRLVLETDFQFYQIFNDVTAAVVYVTQLIGAISDQYLEDVQTVLSIEYLGIYTSGTADPWVTPDTGGDALAMLDEFQVAWSPYFGGAWPASADLAHFISGADLFGGVAYVDALCDQTVGFGVSGNATGQIDWATFDGSPSGFNWDFMVVAHELGHNFGAIHTHDYCPPIDECQPNCGGGTSCPRGTIMSYCHLCPAGIANVDLQFHPFVANEMRKTVEMSCLLGAGLRGGEGVNYRLRFNPTSGTGALGASAELAHDAPNTPTPFVIDLTGTSNP